MSLWNDISDGFSHLGESLEWQEAAYYIAESLAYNEYTAEEQGKPLPKSSLLGVNFFAGWPMVARYSETGADLLIGKAFHAYEYVLAELKRTPFLPKKDSYNTETIRQTAKYSGLQEGLITRILTQLYYSTKKGDIKTTEVWNPVSYDQAREKRKEYESDKGFNYKPWLYGGLIVGTLAVGGYFLNSSADFLDNFTAN